MVIIFEKKPDACVLPVIETAFVFILDAGYKNRNCTFQIFLESKSILACFYTPHLHMPVGSEVSLISEIQKRLVGVETTRFIKTCTVYIVKV